MSKKLYNKKNIKHPDGVQTFDWQKHKQDQLDAYEKWWEEENRRFDNVKCPVCKSTEKGIIRKTDSNKILGPGSRSWTLDEYVVCSKCGVMYKDLNKPKKEPEHPSSNSPYF